MSLDVHALLTAVRKGRRSAVIKALRAATEEERRAAVRPLLDLGKELRSRSIDEQMGLWGREDVYRLATIGVRSGAAAVLGPFVALRWDAESAVEILVDRNPPWLPELVERVLLAPLKADDTAHTRFAMVEPLRVHAGMSRPRTTLYAAGWAASVETTADGGRPADIVEALAADPELAELVPLMLRSERLGHTLGPVHIESSDGPEPTWVKQPNIWIAALVALTRDGVVSRAEVLDRIIDNLSTDTGNRDHALALLEVLNALSMTPTEAAARQNELVSLIPLRQSTVADWALSQLRSVGADGLTAASMEDAVRAALGRREKGIASRALTWAKQAARFVDAEGEPTDGFALAVAEGLNHHRRDVQDAAVALLAGFPGRNAWRPATLTAVSEDAVPGSVTADAAVGDSLPLDGCIVPLPEMPGRVTTVAELVEALADIPLGDSVQDRVLDGAARLLAEHGDEVRSRIERIVRPEFLGPAFGIVGALVGPPPSRRSRLTARLRAWASRDHPAGSEGLNLALATAVADAAADGWSGPLLSRADDVLGVVDPTRLLAELEDYTARNVQPLPLDLDRALIRLPVDAFDAEWRSRVTALPAWARMVRDRAAFGPLPDPVVRLLPPSSHEAAGTKQDDWCPIDHGRWSSDWTWPDVGPWSGPALTFLTPSVRDEWWIYPQETSLPSQPESFAAQLIGRWRVGGAEHTPEPTELLWLAHAVTPAGPVTWLLLALVLTGEKAETRAAGVDMCATLVGRGRFDGAALGQALVAVSSRQDSRLKLGRWASSCAEVGRVHPVAATEMWTAVRVLLDAELGASLAGRAGLADLLLTASDLAHAADARGSFPALEAMASAPGGSQALVRARQLHAHLTRTG